MVALPHTHWRLAFGERHGDNPNAEKRTPNA
jgi:hypothetical protein